MDEVNIECLEAGMVVWHKGQVTVDAIGLETEPTAIGAHKVEVLNSG